MYEKPQFLTPDGYRRRSKNPYKRKVTKKNSPALGRGPSHDKILSSKQFQRNAQRGVSKEAAKLIAQALRGMLKE